MAENTVKTELLEEATMVVAGNEPMGAFSFTGSDILSKLSMKSRKRYEFIRTIGFGGMKTVLLVFDKDTSREVALAFMPDFLERGQAEIEGFVREAFVTASLEHPHIVPIYDVGKDCNDAPYFVMKYLHGAPMDVILKRMSKGEELALRKYTLTTMLRAFRRVCYAMEFAHSKGVLHLDLKPANINFGDVDEVQVLDWGLAQAMDNTRHLHRTSSRSVRRGTPGYMPAELLEDLPEGLSEYTDIYSLGAVLFAILTFRSPASKYKNDVPAIVQATKDGTIGALADFSNEYRAVPSDLEHICRKAMSLYPEDRYMTVREFREDIDNYMDSYPVTAVESSFFMNAYLFVRRNLLSVLALILAATLGWAGYMIFTGKMVFNFKGY